MKKTEKKALQAKLLNDIKKAIKGNRAYLSGKVERDLERSIKKIVKKTSREMNGISKTKLKIRKPVSPTLRYSLAGADGVNPTKQAI